MKKILVIGSSCVDLVINVDNLPSAKADIHVRTQKASMGGCAFNVSDTIRNFGCPNILFSPIGSGVYGDFVRNEFLKRGIETPISQVIGDNGCCYCFVEESGERTFISYHGAEYIIHKEWLDSVDTSEIHSIYICGLEIEEKTGNDIVTWLEEHPGIPVFFAPGPRILRISESLLERLYDRHTIMHLNDDEIREYTKTENLERAMKLIYSRTNNTVIVTTGADGACWYDGCEVGYAAPFKVDAVVDTIGAGDSHVGAVMACLYKGMNIEDAVKTANKVASAVVKEEGALLSKTKFLALFE